MCSPALNHLDPRFAALRGTPLRPTLMRTIETVHQMRTSTEVGRSGFARIERLPDNVGYIELRTFARVDAADDTLAAAMDYLAGSDALVIDLRRNSGGDRRMAALLTSYLFDTEPAHLGESYSSSLRRPMAMAQADIVPARRYLRRDVCLLIGPATSALGRQFAHNLEQLRDAMVVEEAA